MVGGGDDVEAVETVEASVVGGIVRRQRRQKRGNLRRSALVVLVRFIFVRSVYLLRIASPLLYLYCTA